MALKTLTTLLLVLATPSFASATFANGGTNGAVTSYDTAAFGTQHCLGNTQARAAFDRNTGGINSRVSKDAQRTNKWVALNDVNLGPGFGNCGKCVKVTVDVRKQGARVAKTLAAYRDLGLSGGGPITRGSVQPGQTDGGTTTMTTRWVPASCNEPYRVVDNA
ncbi:hypothetical protein HK102_012975 [Quaeritorhiza haematococci]|nr:hypothetical protein HK102_012975 [Quaeritorhiza haematococci]